MKKKLFFHNYTRVLISYEIIRMLFISDIAIKMPSCSKAVGTYFVSLSESQFVIKISVID